MLETLDYTIRIGSTPTFLYFDLYLYSAYAAHFVYFTYVKNFSSFKPLLILSHSNFKLNLTDPTLHPLPCCIQKKGTVYWPIKASPIKSSSRTTNRTIANSGRFTWNSKVSSKTGLKPERQNWLTVRMYLCSCIFANLFLTIIGNSSCFLMNCIRWYSIDWNLNKWIKNLNT